eukprot:gene41655-50832_t
MSVTGKRGAGIPIVLLHDAIGGIITVEMKNGCLYRGTLDDCQDNMNMTIKNCTKVAPTGKESQIEVAYIRGSQVIYISVPEMLQRAPFFNRIKMWRKFKGHAQIGLNTAAINAGGRGGGFMPRGPPRGGGGGRGNGPPPSSYGGPSPYMPHNAGYSR